MIVDRQRQTEAPVFDDPVVIERHDVRVALRIRPADECAPADVHGARVAEIRPRPGPDRPTGVRVTRERQEDEERDRDA